MWRRKVTISATLFFVARYPALAGAMLVLFPVSMPSVHAVNSVGLTVAHTDCRQTSLLFQRTLLGASKIIFFELHPDSNV